MRETGKGRPEGEERDGDKGGTGTEESSVLATPARSPEDGKKAAFAPAIVAGLAEDSDLVRILIRISFRIRPFPGLRE